jgi:hypothetical protein
VDLERAGVHHREVLVGGAFVWSQPDALLEAAAWQRTQRRRPLEQVEPLLGIQHTLRDELEQVARRIEAIGCICGV